MKWALPFDSSTLVDVALAELPLARVNPFRLIGMFPAHQAFLEWRWNLKHLERLDHPWRTNTWISSGFEEPGAQQTRGKMFREALRHESAESLDWLRRLHGSHGVERSPYSHCMHGADAATVSYTEVVVSQAAATMRYQQGALCSDGSISVRSLDLAFRRKQLLRMRANQTGRTPKQDVA